MSIAIVSTIGHFSASESSMAGPGCDRHWQVVSHDQRRQARPVTARVATVFRKCAREADHSPDLRHRDAACRHRFAVPADRRVRLAGLRNTTQNGSPAAEVIQTSARAGKSPTGPWRKIRAEHAPEPKHTGLEKYRAIPEVFELRFDRRVGCTSPSRRSAYPRGRAIEPDLGERKLMRGGDHPLA